MRALLTAAELMDWRDGKVDLDLERRETTALEISALRFGNVKLAACLRKVRLLLSDDELREHGLLRDVEDALYGQPL